MRSTHELSHQLENMHAGLDGVVAVLHRSRLAAAAVAGAERAIVNALGFSACFTVSNIGLRVGVGEGLTPSVALSGLLLVALPPVVLRVGGAWRAKPALSEAAERLDLQLASHNQFASALELLDRSDPSPLERMAIAQGVDRLRMLGHTTLTVPSYTRRPWRNCGLAAAAALLIGIGLLVPVRTTNNELGRLAALPDKPAIDRTYSPADPERVFVPPLVPAARQAISAAQPSVLNPRQTPRGTQASSRTVRTGDKSGSAMASDDASADSANGGDGTDSPGAKSGSASRSGRSVTSAPPTPRRPDSASSDAAGQTPGSKPPSDGAEKKSSPVQAGSAKPSEEPNGGSANGANGQPPPGAEPGVGGEGSGGEGGTPPKGTSGKSQAASNSETASGGNGQAAGQDTPKKSRGVAPLLLGRPLPDLFEGRPLPGSEDRTQRDVSPAANPAAPAAAVPPVSKPGVEKLVTRYGVPADSVRSVASYFRNFHKDADAK